MTTTALVSVVIPTRNRADMLRQTLATVLAQDVWLEVVVVDEGSTDATPQVLDDLADGRVLVVRHATPQGLPRARNAGIAAARGDVIAFVDDDDLWLPEKLRLQLDAMDAQRRSWAVGGALTFSEEPRGPRLHAIDMPMSADEIVARLPYANAVPGGGSNAVVRRAPLLAVGGFDVAPHTVEDWDLWIRLSQRGRPAVVDAPVVAYRRHPGNMSRKVEAVLAGTRAIDERYRGLRGGSPLDWADAHRWLAREALASGDRATASRLHLSSWVAGHPGSVRRLARSLAPVAPRPPVARVEDADHWLDRLRPRPVVAWPEGVERWLTDVLADARSAR